MEGWRSQAPRPEPAGSKAGAQLRRRPPCPGGMAHRPGGRPVLTREAAGQAPLYEVSQWGVRSRGTPPWGCIWGWRRGGGFVRNAGKGTFPPWRGQQCAAAPVERGSPRCPFAGGDGWKAAGQAPLYEASQWGVRSRGTSPWGRDRGWRRDGGFVRHAGKGTFPPWRGQRMRDRSRRAGLAPLPFDGRRRTEGSGASPALRSLAMGRPLAGYSPHGAASGDGVGVVASFDTRARAPSRPGAGNECATAPVERGSPRCPFTGGDGWKAAGQAPLYEAS